MYGQQNFTQLQTIFGAGYIAEQHADEARGYLPPAEHQAFALNFDELLKTLRTALSLR